MSEQEAGNGTAPVSARERIAAELEAEIDGLVTRERALELQLAEVKDERKSFEKTLKHLRGEPLIKHNRGPGRPRGTAGPGVGPVRAVPSKVGPEALANIEQVVRDFAAHNDEFRQVDIRSLMVDMTSSKMSQAFEQLRQDGMIRLARKDGNNKFYRLTESARVTGLAEGMSA